MFGLRRGKKQAKGEGAPNGHAGSDTGVPDPHGDIHAAFEAGDIDEVGEAAPVYLRSPAEALQPESVPVPPDTTRPAERSRLFLFFNGIMSLAIFALVAAGAVFLVVKHQFDSPGPLDQTRTVLIPQGETVSGIARRLEREGVISDAYIFMAGVWVARTAGRLKAGEYLFKDHESMRQVMASLVEGKAILHRLTIPEGWTSEQIVARLNAEELLSGTLDTVPPEGTLLPDTYKFTRGDSRAAIIERMQKAHQHALERVWARRDQDVPVSTREELVILASIVEKETGKADERPRVAAVFANRLRKSMRLQSDPTIIYGIIGGKGALGRPILRSEIEQVTPYNTYRIDGLPPTPIANPGVAALEAAANPSRTDDLYFVASGDGGHVFARTLDEHNKNVARWRKIEKEMREAAEKALAEGEVEAADDADEADPGDDGKPGPEARAAPRLDLRSPVR